MDKTFTSYKVEDRSYVAYIKREIHKELMQCNFSGKQVAEIDIIVSELSSNLVKHAGYGELLYRAHNIGDKNAEFEIISIDGGPGMSDPARMMKDGTSTTSTLGQGLGAMNRLSTTFQLFSIPEWGTVAYSKYSTGEQSLRKRTFDLDVHALCVNKANEFVSGDGYTIKRTSSTVNILFGDGLGHGEHAHEAVSRASKAFIDCRLNEPVEILRHIHENVRRSRGLVATVVVLDLQQKVWKICGVGNIMTRLYTGISYKNYMAYNGTLGLNIPGSMKDSVFEAEKNQHMIMASDGIRSRWDLTKYPSIFKYDNTVLAAAIYKDFTRRTDDASILIAKVI